MLGDHTLTAQLHNLREQGWRDWQLLLMLHNRAVNIRIREAGIDVSDPANADVVRAMFRIAEGPDDSPLDLRDFAADELDIRLKVLLDLAMAQHKLQSRSRTPDELAMHRLLVSRYGFARDDVEHTDLLGNGTRLPHYPYVLPRRRQTQTQTRALALLRSRAAWRLDGAATSGN